MSLLLLLQSSGAVTPFYGRPALTRTAVVDAEVRVAKV